MAQAGRGKTRSINVSEDREHKFELFPTSGKIHRLKKQMLPTKAVQQTKGKGKLKPRKKFISAIPQTTATQKQTTKKQKQAKLQEPKKIKKSYAVRAPNKQAASQSIQYSQWNDRFGGAKPSGTKMDDRFGPPQWQSTSSSSQSSFTKDKKVSLKNAFNMCLNGGTFYPGTGCLCVDNFSGDFCDECLPGWSGDQCDNPQNMCATTSDGINCYGKWLFNLTLLDMPITAKTVNLGYNGLYKSGAVRKKMTFMNEVEELNLNGNYLSRFPLSMFKNQPFLRTLNVNSNFLFALPSDLFDFTEDLTSIDFKNNNIKLLNKQSFINTRNLKHVDFSNNNFEGVCKGLFAYQSKLAFVAFNRNDELPLPLNKWFGECPYDVDECDRSYPMSQYGGPVINLRKRIGAFGQICD